MSAVSSSRCAFAASLLLLLPVSAPRATLARWAPVTGERLEWQWRIEGEHELLGIQLVKDSGRTNELAYSLSDASLEVRDVLELSARDIFVARDEYGPLRLERELVRARRSTSAAWMLRATANDEDALTTVSPFEGAQLVFDWDPDACELRAAFAEQAEELADEDLLAGLDEGLDLRGLLGGRSRAPGDTWQLDEDALQRLLRPAGELALVAPEADFEGQHDSAAFGWLLGAALVAGDCDAWGCAEYERVGWEGGRRVARIALRATVEGRGSVRAALERLVETLGSGRVWLDYGKEIEVEHTLRFAGALSWDLEAQRAHSLELHGDSESRIVIRLELWGVQLEYVASLRGGLELRVEVEALEH